MRHHLNDRTTCDAPAALPTQRRGGGGRTLLSALAVLLSSSFAGAQTRQAEFEVHDRGELWETMKDDGTIGAPSPTNPFQFYPTMDWPGGPNTLVDKGEQRSYSAGAGFWMGGRRGGSLFFTENGPFAYVDPAGTYGPVERTNNFIEEPGYDPARAEQTIVARWTTSENVRVVRTSRAWSFRGLNTFVLVEYEVTNGGAGPLTDVFVGFPYLLRPSYQDVVVHNGWGDDFNRTDDFVAYDSTRGFVYSWDDTPNFSIPQDVGNYWAEANELRTTGYAGVALLEAPPGAGGEAQPSTVLWAQLLNNENRLTVSTSTRESLYAILSGADRSLQAAAGEHLTPFVLQGAGPYTMAPGQTLRFVLAQAVNGIPLQVARTGLAAQPRLPAGLDSLRGSIDRARVLAANGSAVTGVPPPSPPVQLLALPSSRSVAVSWPPTETTWIDPFTGGRIAEYRVYRSDRAFAGPFTQVARVRVDNATDRTRYFDEARNEWRYIDNSASLGVRYFYAVTAIDTDGHQSWLTNRNEEAVTVTSSPSADALGVRVFPNPFREVSGFPSTGDENSIVWNNLPARATIRIYTAGGELVRTLEHDDAASGQKVWDQLSDARQRTAPGMYFWTVQSDVGAAQGTLLIIK